LYIPAVFTQNKFSETDDVIHTFSLVSHIKRNRPGIHAAATAENESVKTRNSRRMLVGGFRFTWDTLQKIRMDILRHTSNILYSRYFYVMNKEFTVKVDPDIHNEVYLTS
jgi:hypothetical protein